MKTLLIRKFIPAVMLTLAINASAQTFTTIYSFSNSPDGAYPSTFAVVALAGNTLYGTTDGGGNTSQRGTVFKVNTDGTSYTVLWRFTNNPDGGDPEGGLTLVGSTLYGTTVGGGTGHGTIFKVNTDGTGYMVLTNFNGNDGSGPHGRLTLAGSTLYGITDAGGNPHANSGTVFKVNTNGTGLTVLRSFTNSPDGSGPNGGITLSGGTLYGTTQFGGIKGVGTVFKVNTNGTGYTVLKSFTNSPDGSEPYGGLALAGSTLYGTTYGGGSAGYGTVFQINTNGTGYKVLENFTAYSYTNGAYPRAGLILAGSTLYGTTSAGGSATGNGYGTVFQINTNGTGYMVIKRFTGNDGEQPGPLTLFGNTLYGTTDQGANAGWGSVFALKLSNFAFVTISGNFGFINKQFLMTLTGPAGSNAVVSASTNLQTWIPLQTNSLGSGTLIFTDKLATNYLRRFYRANLK